MGGGKKARGGKQNAVEFALWKNLLLRLPPPPPPAAAERVLRTSVRRWRPRLVRVRVRAITQYKLQRSRAQILANSPPATQQSGWDRTTLMRVSQSVWHREHTR